ncbi:hypothetical protein HK100_000869 [Physocladia obscura]|uniref:G domain-containing protein n=1 Tax=Physocladia obscura TaxID=109957 RepID=A0AAD5T0J7_9FUNG|nr:hypothetical protein HK100_000869 [Physocladia obscura]
MHIITVLLIGRTRAGKTSLKHMLGGGEPTCNAGNADPTPPSCEPVCVDGKCIEFIDGPGFLDTNPSVRTENIQNLIKFIKTKEYLDCVYILFPASEVLQNTDFQEIADIISLFKGCTIVPVITKTDNAKTEARNADLAKNLSTALETSALFVGEDRLDAFKENLLLPKKSIPTAALPESVARMADQVEDLYKFLHELKVILNNVDRKVGAGSEQFKNDVRDIVNEAKRNTENQLNGPDAILVDNITHMLKLTKAELKGVQNNADHKKADKCQDIQDTLNRLIQELEGGIKTEKTLFMLKKDVDEKKELVEKLADGFGRK